MAPAAPGRGPAGAEQAGLLGEGFILQAAKDVSFLLLRSTATSHHCGDGSVPTSTPTGNATSSSEAGASLRLARKTFLKMQARDAHFLGQQRPFLLMENCEGSCNADQSGRLLGLQGTPRHFMPGRVIVHLLLSSTCLWDQGPQTHALGMQHSYDLYVHFIPRMGYVYVM